MEWRGVLPSDTAQEIVARARSSAGLSDEEAMAIAVRETRRHRADSPNTRRFCTAPKLGGFTGCPTPRSTDY